MSTALTKLGVGRGDIVAVGSEKRNEFVPTVLAIVFTGATYTPYDLKSGRGETKYLSCTKLFKRLIYFMETLKFSKIILTEKEYSV